MKITPVNSKAQSGIQTFEIENQYIYVIDGLVSSELITDFHSYVSNLSFRKKEKDDYDDVYPIFSVDFKTEIFATETEIGRLSSELVKKYFKETDYKLNRSYINMSFYGDMEFPHRDCGLDEKDVTVLYYVNEKWDYRWGGETLFYSKKDTCRAILPTPGRFLLFPGNIEHTGTVPTRICNLPRFSLAMKFKPV